jgi:hypothetical protein
MSEDPVVRRDRAGRDLMPAFGPKAHSRVTDLRLVGGEDPRLGGQETTHVERHKREVPEVYLDTVGRIREHGTRPGN